jgi:aspartate/methionine/tyrosine aminotransferase
VSSPPFQSPNTARDSLLRLDASKIREIANAGRGLEGVIPLWFGESDSATPDFVRVALKASLDRGETFYEPNLGLAELRQAIAAYLGRTDRPVPTERICVTGSGVNALMICAQALLEPGDRVVLPTPHWPNLQQIPRVLGAQVDLFPLTFDEGVWIADIEALCRAITPGTRMVMINAPSNPTGWTMSAAEQAILVAHCRRTGTWILADEVYERISFETYRAPSFLDLCTAEDRLVVVNSFSKSWAMTGWRLGWIVAPSALMPSLAQLVEYNISCVPAFVQRGGIAAIERGEAFVEASVERYRRMRDLVVSRLAENPRIRISAPAGAIYAFFRIDGVADSFGFATDLLSRARVGLAPGIAFGPAGEGYFRLCFAASEALLSEACERITGFLDRS